MPHTFASVTCRACSLSLMRRWYMPRSNRSNDYSISKGARCLIARRTPLKPSNKTRSSSGRTTLMAGSIKELCPTRQAPDQRHGLTRTTPHPRSTGRCPMCHYRLRDIPFLPLDTRSQVSRFLPMRRTLLIWTSSFSRAANRFSIGLYANRCYGVLLNLYIVVNFGLSCCFHT